MTAVSLDDLPSPRSRPTKRAEAKQRTRQRVMAAAREMFVSRGFEESTIRDIAAAADLSTGAVFASFADKNELFDAVMAESFGATVDKIDAARRQAHASTAERLTAMFETAYRQYAPQLPLVRAALSQFWARRECARLLQQDGFTRARALIEAALRTGVEAGEIAESLDRALVAELLWDAYLANYHRAVFDGWSLEALTARVQAQTRLVLCGYLRR
jgi:AcrR family transcriptional regulator